MADLPKHAHLNRFREIAAVLARHGFFHLLNVFGLERFVPFHHAIPNPAGKRPSIGPVHLRMAFEELGVTFVKLGQILSTRADLLPPNYQAELAKLQDAAAPEPGEVMCAVVEAELGRPIAALFASFDREPLAAASIGQAHAATLFDGTEVVVKVRRPGAVEQVAEDLEILENLAATASRHWEVADRYDLVGLVQEFAQTLRAELDYIHEGRNAERFAADLADDPAVHIPRVFWEFTTSRVLTLERIRGLKIDDVDALTAAGIDCKRLAAHAAEIEVRMVFENGFFHADPHPGNFFVEPDGRLGLIDFGMAGTVDTRTREHLADMLLAVTRQDAEALVDVVLNLGIAQRKVDRQRLSRDMGHLLAAYTGRPLGDIVLGRLLRDALEVVRRHHLQLPANLALLVKTVIMSEGLGARLDPDFRLTVVLAPYAERLMLRQYSPLRLARQLGRAGIDAARLGVDLPQQARRILAEIERGNFQMGVRPEGFEPLVRRLERLANRIVLGILTAAFVIGLAVLLSVYQLPGREQGAAVLFAIGFAAASALGAYLAWSILRSGRG